jgi:hypothetical protein
MFTPHHLLKKRLQNTCRYPLRARGQTRANRAATAHALLPLQPPANERARRFAAAAMCGIGGGVEYVLKGELI